MPRADVKICGIATAADYDVCARAGARWIGMVFFPKSSRHLSLEVAAALANHADSYTGDRPERVALTVDMADDALDAVIQASRPDYIQLHGNETPDRAKAIKARFNVSIIKALRIGTASDLDVCSTWDTIADWLLLDAKSASSDMPGGTGHSFDWRLLSSYKGMSNWMLAGGLKPDNVTEAISMTGARALDVSSGVESALGKKDHGLIRSFIRAAEMG
ncbi:phosphoribosylanthranilate isomerase [Candidatus Puniceispirillum marinum]|uniref:N-(5'-phosphoribosyl)anthranilate isomerase n=1 Tax=Puniceispirillum marinum (strain IMCC1322) TaxID=488538 RepID=D5BTA1_PUNMI|nr:phosphoribosylanthranilate isomerase [Candidatus Puniceispirillum marinum]ADE39498.1 Tryptophan synthase [Candidatus Puniceispirillum marinum IMCC1322]